MKSFENLEELNSIDYSDEIESLNVSIFKDNNNNKDDYYSTLFQDYFLKTFENKGENKNLGNLSEKISLQEQIQIFFKGEKENNNDSKIQISPKNEGNDSFLILNNTINNIYETDSSNMEIDLGFYLNNHLKEINEEILKKFEKKNDFNIKTENSVYDMGNYLGKKTKLFRVIYPKQFIIFHRGDLDKYPRNLINDILNKNRKRIKFYISKNDKNPKKSELDKNNEARKNKSDNIRKKIKARFIKALKNAINTRLKNSKSIQFFNLLPQSFVSNISRRENRGVLELTFKDIFSKKFDDKEKVCKADIKKYNENISTLEYLENNKDISEKSNYFVFKNMKYYQIYEEYLNSKEFENEIIKLKQEKESNAYIENYINLSDKLNDFFYQ